MNLKNNINPNLNIFQSIIYFFFKLKSLNILFLFFYQVIVRDLILSYKKKNKRKVKTKF